MSSANDSVSVVRVFLAMVAGALLGFVLGWWVENHLQPRDNLLVYKGGYTDRFGRAYSGVIESKRAAAFVILPAVGAGAGLLWTVRRHLRNDEC